MLTSKRLTIAACLVAAGFAAGASTALAREQIRIVGSSTVYPFATVVAERLGARGSMKTPVIESTGTGGGMKLFCAGVGPRYPDISNASRAMKDSEWQNCQKHGVKDIIQVVIGNDGIAFANSTQGPKLNFTRAQLWTALAARGPMPQRWNEIDPSLPDAKIRVLIPPPTSGTRDAWNHLVMSKGCPEAIKLADRKACKLIREDGAVIEAGENDTLIVQKLEADPHAFGIFGYSYLDNNRDKIQGASVEGVDISLESIQSYQYPIARPLFFYVKKAHIGMVPGIRKYMAAFTSAAAMGDDGYLADVGLVPLDSVTAKKIRLVVDNQVAMGGVGQ